MYQMKSTLNTFGKVVIKICSFVVLFRMSNEIAQKRLF